MWPHTMTIVPTGLVNALDPLLSSLFSFLTALPTSEGGEGREEIGLFWPQGRARWTKQITYHHHHIL